MGAPSPAAIRYLERLVDRFHDVGRLEVPDRRDWMCAGHALRSIGLENSYELVRRARLTNDALILATASRFGAALITRNTADFELLSKHIAADVIAV